MTIITNKEGINPTAEFISDQHTGKFIEVLPNTYLIKGAKNDRGFDQGYALSNNKKEWVLLDVVEEATREAVQSLVKDGYNIKAILISGEKVLNDAYADLETISKEAGGAEIYIHPNIAPRGHETKILNGSDETINSFNLEVQETTNSKNGAVLLYSNKNGGILFAGDSAKGSGYDSDTFLFTREKFNKQSEELEIEKFWKNFGKDFDYLFPRKGKPAIEVDKRTQTTILDRIARGA